jgi:hypothetical protein
LNLAAHDHLMTTTTRIAFPESEEADHAAPASSGDQGGGGGRLHAFLRRPVALLSAAAVMGLTALGVMTLGTLYGSSPTSVAASGMAGPAGGIGGKISGGPSSSVNVSLGAKSYRLDEGGELISE